MFDFKYKCGDELHGCRDQSARGDQRGGVGSARLAHARDRPVHVHLRALHRGHEHAVEAHLSGQGELAIYLQGANNHDQLQSHVFTQSSIRSRLGTPAPRVFAQKRVGKSRHQCSGTRI